MNAGADANSRDIGNTPISARQILRDWYNRLRGKKPSNDRTFHLPALIIALKTYQLHDRWVNPPENPPLIKAHLARGADPNSRDEDGETALLWASYQNYMATGRLLLDKGADVNAHDKEGWTALMIAIDDGNWASSAVLVHHGADVILNNKHHETALKLAIKQGHFGQAALLRQFGAKE